MPVLSLAKLKRNFGFNDAVAIKYEEKDKELIIHLPIEPKYRNNDEIINKAQNLVEKRKAAGWSRQDFMAEPITVTNTYINPLEGENTYEAFQLHRTCL